MFLFYPNIWPHSLAKFDPSRHLCIADNVFSENGAVVIIKWSMMRQDRQHIDTVPIPHLGNEYICPVKASNLMLSHIFHVRDNPLFQIPTEGRILPLNGPQARKHLASFCQYLNLARHITSHDFRRDGAT